jgi:hypothetical protein
MGGFYIEKDLLLSNTVYSARINSLGTISVSCTNPGFLLGAIDRLPTFEGYDRCRL